MSGKIIILAALIPLFTGFIWYNKRIFGSAWIRLTGTTEEKAKRGNSAVMFIVTYILCLLLVIGVYNIAVHQMAAMGLLHENQVALESFMTEHGHKFRTFGHGVLHGAFGGLMFALPILGVNAIFEKQKVGYIVLNVGYWVVTMALMGGVICQWG